MADYDYPRYFRPDPIPANLRKPLSQWVDQQLRRIEISSGTTNITIIEQDTRIIYLEESDPVQNGRLDGLEQRADETDTEQGIQDGRLDAIESTRIHWVNMGEPNRGRWIAGTYEAADAVRHNYISWVANKQTTEEPIITAGAQSWVAELVGTPTLSDETSLTGLYITGIKVTWPNGGLVNSIRFVIPALSTNFQFSVWLRTNPDEIFKSVQQLLAPIVGTVDETIINIAYSTLWKAGDTADILVIIQANSQPNTISAEWGIKNENGDPSIKKANFQSNSTEIRIHYTPESGDATGLQAGAASGMEGGNISFAGLSWPILASSDNGSHCRLTVPDQGRPSEDTRNMTITWGTTYPLPFLRDSGFFAGQVDIRGLEGTNIDSLVESDDFFGVDILITSLIPPNDWDLLAFTE